MSMLWKRIVSDDSKNNIGIELFSKSFVLSYQILTLLLELEILTFACIIDFLNILKSMYQVRFRTI